MRERRRAGASVVPKARPPADRGLLEPPVDKPTEHQHDSWRVLRFVSEFVEGFDALADIGTAVTCFGSARIGRGDPLYRQGMEVGAALSRRGVAVITGGGPGMMEAVHRGCMEAGGVSVGSNTELPNDESLTYYVAVGLQFPHLLVRQTLL